MLFSDEANFTNTGNVNRHNMYYWANEIWGFVKERVMAVAPTKPDDMKERIRQACTDITPQLLAEVRRSFYQRINKCLQVEGHHFEHLL